METLHLKMGKCISNTIKLGSGEVSKGPKIRPAWHSVVILASRMSGC